MEEVKKIVNCPYCNEPCRVPAYKHVKITCPNHKCGLKSEFKNGELETVTKRRKPNYALIFAFLFIVLFFGAVILWGDSGASGTDAKTEVATTNISPPAPVPDFVEVTNYGRVTHTSQLPTFSHPNENNDTASGYGALDAVKDGIDLALDIAENLIEEEMERGHKEHAQKLYDDAASNVYKTRDYYTVKKYRKRLSEINHKICGCPVIP